MGTVANCKKNDTLEFIRAYATVAVVTIHTVNSGIIYSGEAALQGLVAFFLAVKNIVYWAVPCFLMITGYLLLDPKREVPLKKLFGKYILRMVWVLAIFGAAFSWIEIFFEERMFSPMQILRAYRDVMIGHTWAHLWYVYALIGIYLLLPLYRAAARCLPDRELLYLVTVIFAFQTVLPVCEAFTGVTFGVSLHLSAVFPLYLLLGEVRRRELLTLGRATARIVFSAATLLIAVLSVIQVLCDVDLSMFFGYASPLTVLMAYALFCIMQQHPVRKSGLGAKIIGEISAKSFAIYIIHMFFVNLEYQFLHLHLLDSISKALLIPVLIVLDLMLSYLAAWCMKKIPFISKLV